MQFVVTVRRHLHTVQCSSMGDEHCTPQPKARVFDVCFSFFCDGISQHF